MTCAFIFPGQAAQAVGMMTDFIDEYAVVRETLQQISDNTSTDIAALFQTADEATLNDGRLSGLLVVASSVALYHLARGAGLSAGAFAGYSVGQYAALYASGILSLEEMLAVLTQRQVALDDAAKAQESCMVAVLGVPLARVNEILAGFEGAEISNYNCPNNYSVACHAQDADALVERFTKADAVRALVLPVAGGWHSHFMRPAAQAIQPSLDALPLQRRDTLFVENVSGEAMSDPGALRAALYEHVYRPVQWEQSMRTLFDAGCTDFIEIGYGDQLSKFVKFTDRRRNVYPTGTLQRYEAAVRAKTDGRIP